MQFYAFVSLLRRGGKNVYPAPSRPYARSRQSDDFDSFTECGRTACECRRRVTCAMDDAWWKSSRHRMSQETVTGRFPSSCPTGGG
ncbi:hypothetical protein EVAR_99054_1 [Eumeta japonica]|uniref:Uncharacterized protein n=1 Tax=Eumeta variegata TaxID=151549 RepID=A0A4C1XXQ1_EUMVA|nr:hypothetical protein EVAR_99054_1 [Eumeta japonica]